MSIVMDTYHGPRSFNLATVTNRAAQHTYSRNKSYLVLNFLACSIDVLRNPVSHVIVVSSSVQVPALFTSLGPDLFITLLVFQVLLFGGRSVGLLVPLWSKRKPLNSKHPPF